MNRLPIVIFTVLVACLLPLAAAPKIAVVRIKDIYSERPEVKAAQAEADRAKEDILLDPRAEELRTGLDTLKEIQTRIQAVTRRSANDEARKLAQEFEVKRLETKALQEDFETFRNNRERAINTELVKQMRASLDRISALAQETARAKGYDVVMDSSGISNTGIPFLLYVKDAPDITDELIAILDKEHAEASPAANPASPNETPENPPQD